MHLQAGNYLDLGMIAIPMLVYVEAIFVTSLGRINGMGESRQLNNRIFHCPVYKQYLWLLFMYSIIVSACPFFSSTVSSFKKFLVSSRHAFLS